MEPLREELLDVFSSIAPRRGEVPFYSTVTGDVVDGADLDAEYWYQNLRQPVRFEPVTRLMMERGFDAFVEVSPHPVITASIEDTAAAVAAGPVAAGGTLRRDEGGWERFLRSAAALFARGVDVDWPTLCADPADERPDLPTYAFQRERYWLDTGAKAGDARAYGLSGVEHPLLGAAVEVPETGGLVLSGRLAPRDQPWLLDHQVRGEVVVPGACLAEIAVRAGDEAGCPVLEELAIHIPLVVAESTTAHLRVGIGESAEDGTRTVTVHARPQHDEGPWTCHATGTLAPPAATPDPAAAWATAWPPQGAEPIPVSGVYDDLTARGLHYGPVFRGLEAAWHRDGETFADVALPEGGRADADAFGVHPALLDAALHALVLGGALPAARAGTPWMPFAWSGVRLHATGALRVRVRITAAATDGTVRVDIADSAGHAVLTVDALTLRPLPEGGLVRPAAHADHLYHQAWVHQHVNADADAPTAEAAGGRLGGVGREPARPRRRCPRLRHDPRRRHLAGPRRHRSRGRAGGGLRGPDHRQALARRGVGRRRAARRDDRGGRARGSRRGGRRGRGRRVGPGALRAVGEPRPRHPARRGRQRRPDGPAARRAAGHRRTTARPARRRRARAPAAADRGRARPAARAARPGHGARGRVRGPDRHADRGLRGEPGVAARRRRPRPGARGPHPGVRTGRRAQLPRRGGRSGHGRRRRRTARHRSGRGRPRRGRWRERPRARRPRLRHRPRLLRHRRGQRPARLGPHA
ncbi:polyketide synthase dehydratase domain-containing protein [Streptomyces sp. PmtG]